jgi:DNA-directed RNA polymerase subunit RPC12/RpoP
MTEKELLKAYIAEMFTLFCKVNVFAKYSDKITAGMDSDNNDQGASCPYCASKFKGNEELSKHIDRMHHGLGLLEGDSRRW